MAFTGNLSTFSVTTLLRVIRDEQLSGALSLQCERGMKQLLVEGGQVRALMGSANRVKLGMILTEMGLLEETDLQRALAAQPQIGEKLGQILLDRDQISEALLAEALAIQMEDMLLEVLSWPDGVYHFLVSEYASEELAELTPLLGAVLSQGLDRPAELQAAARVIPSLRHFVRRTASAGRPPVDLTAEERFVLARADGTRRVRPYLEDLNPVPYDGLAALARLAGLGLVEFPAAAMPLQESAEEQTRALLLDLMRSVAAVSREERIFQRDMRRRMQGLLPRLAIELPRPPMPGRTELEEAIVVSDEQESPFDVPAAARPAPAAPAEEPAPPARPAAREPPPAPETPLAFVPGTEADAFPWVHPGASESPPAAPATASEAGRGPDLGLDLDGGTPGAPDAPGGFDLPDLPDLPDLAGDLDRPAAAPGAGGQEEEGGADLFEDQVARKVRYNRLKSTIKMAYNRIRLRKLNHFEVLELPLNASPRDLRRAYREMQKRFQSKGILKDRDTEYLQMGEEILKRVEEAYQILSDNERRRQYLAEIKRARTQVGERKQDALQQYRIGMSAYNEGDFEQARRSFDRAIALDSSNPVFYEMIHTLDEEQRASDSSKYYRAGLLAWKRKNDSKRAILLLSKAIEMAPGQAAYHWKLGELLSEERRHFDQAVASLDRALERDPGNPEIHLSMARLLIKSGKLQEAADRFAETLRWDDRNAEARTSLRELREKGYNPSGAESKKKKGRG